jgi:hypothetical protein
MHSYNQNIDSLAIYDNKEFFVQKEDHEQMRYQTCEGSRYTAVVREFNGDTWQFGPVHEVQFDRFIRCTQLAEFLQENMFPHIELDSMLGCRVKLDRPFIRSDIALKAWHKLKCEYISIAQSALQVTEDSMLIIIRDGKVPIRDLTLENDGELIQKYASQQYVDFVLKKAQIGASNE